MAREGVHLEVREGYGAEAATAQVVQGHGAVIHTDSLIVARGLDAQILAEAVGAVDELQLAVLDQGPLHHGDALVGIGSEGQQRQIQLLPLHILALDGLAHGPVGVVGVDVGRKGPLRVVFHDGRHLVPGEDHRIGPGLGRLLGGRPIPDRSDGLPSLGGEGLGVEIRIVELEELLHVLGGLALGHELALDLVAGVGNVHARAGKDAHPAFDGKDLRAVDKGVFVGVGGKESLRHEQGVLFEGPIRQSGGHLHGGLLLPGVQLEGRIFHELGREPGALQAFFHLCGGHALKDLGGRHAPELHAVHLQISVDGDGAAGGALGAAHVQGLLDEEQLRGLGLGALDLEVSNIQRLQDVQNDVAHTLSPSLAQADAGLDAGAAVRDLDPFLPTLAAHAAALQGKVLGDHGDGL